MRTIWAMDSTVSNLLYRHPELYEAVYDGAEHAVARLAEAVFRERLGRMPESLLDIGCGTGRDLAYLAKHIPEVVGVDYQQSMIDFARAQRPGIDFRTGDMRTLRLGRRFEAITCFGWALANIHANREIDQVMATCAAHSAPGALLFLELIDPARIGELATEFTIDVPGLRAEATAEYTAHPAEQLLERQRIWRRADGPVRDSVKFRLLYPKEVEYYLDNHGFDVLGRHDLPERLNAASTFVLARHREGAR